MKTIFIANLPFEMNKKEVCEQISLLLSPLSFQDLRLKIDKYTGISKGYAFIDVEDKYYWLCMEILRDSHIKNRKLVVGEGLPRAPRMNVVSRAQEFLQVFENAIPQEAY